MTDEPEDIQKARRLFLKAGVYAAPAIVAALSITRHADAQTPSCLPSTCLPNSCAPLTCAPSGCAPVT